MFRNSAVSKTILAVLLLWSFSTEAREHGHGPVDGSVASTVAASLVQAPEDLDVCFSPEERCDIKIVKFVESAKTSLDIAIYDINLGSLVSAIVAKSKKIPVRLVVDRSQAKTAHSAVGELIQAGVQIRFGTQRGHGIMHNKFVIVDGKMMETGSFNQTNGAAFSNNENQIYLANPKVLDRYKERFEFIWGRGKPARISTRS